MPAKKNNKVILMADCHHGENNNSEKTNEDLLAFYDFTIEYAKKFKIKKLFCIGDYFHQRNKLDVLTANYGIRGANKLSGYFDGLTGKLPQMLPGNHDLYYRHSRDVQSLAMLEGAFEIISEPTYIEDHDVLISPWVTGAEDWDVLVNKFNECQPRFVFGHFEFSQFRMNDHYIMEHGYSHKAFKSAERVFTGHYHQRQEKDNVVYVGSPIPFNFNDANDAERGFCVLDLDTGEYEFVNFGEVAVKSITHEEFLAEDFDAENTANTSLRVQIGENIDDETMDKVKEKLENGSFRATKIAYTPSKYRELVESVNSEEIDSVENIDEAVIKFLRASDPVDGIDNDLLINLYQEVVRADES